MVKFIKQKKYGFSLAEALVSMLVLSVFFVATSKVMTHRQPSEVQEFPHGYFECYVENGVLKQKEASDMNVGAPRDVNVCDIQPPSGIAYTVIYSMSNRGDIKTSIQPQFNDHFTVTRNELNNFYATFLQEDTADAVDVVDLQPNDLRNYLRKSYPTSEIRRLLDSGEYRGPALFIGW